MAKGSGGGAGGTMGRMTTRVMGHLGPEGFALQDKRLSGELTSARLKLDDALNKDAKLKERVRSVRARGGSGRNIDVQLMRNAEKIGALRDKISTLNRTLIHVRAARKG